MKSKPRQKIRRGVLLGMLGLFPVTLYYFSPVLSLEAASKGVAAGSLIVFAALFIVSLLLGRAFCGWACPAGGIQEMTMLIRGRTVRPRRIAWIKWLIWVPWILVLLLLILRAGGLTRVDFLYGTTKGVSAGDVPGLIALAAVVLLFAILSLAVGRRAACHTVCWMAPFMIIGRAVSSTLGWRSLRLSARTQDCNACGRCTRHCPMSLPVTEKVRQDHLEDPNCILCGSCVDACPRGVLQYAFCPPPPKAKAEPAIRIAAGRRSCFR
jgi:polyferredoxin